MSKKSHYASTIDQIVNSMNYFHEVNNDNEMSKAYIDEYTTNQQKLRDKKITELLSQYVDAYSYKNKSNKWYKGILLGICAIILVVFTIVFILLMFKVSATNAETTLEGIVQLITVCITFLTLIVSLLKIITKYVFPEKEEEYITRIVEIIQNNDLENKKENIRVQTNIRSEFQKSTLDFEEFS